MVKVKNGLANLALTLVAALGMLVNTAKAQAVVGTKTVVEPTFFLRAATSWNCKGPDRCWDDWSWKNPRDWWPYRDFHLAFSWPAGGT